MKTVRTYTTSFKGNTIQGENSAELKSKMLKLGANLQDLELMTYNLSGAG